MKVLYEVMSSNKEILGSVVKDNDGFTVTKGCFKYTYKNIKDVFEYVKNNKIYLRTPISEYTHKELLDEIEKRLIPIND